MGASSELVGKRRDVKQLIDSGYGVEVTRSCHICLQPTLNLNFSICEECRQAIIFAKELRKAAEHNVKSSKM